MVMRDELKQDEEHFLSSIFRSLGGKKITETIIWLRQSYNNTYRYK